MATEIPRQLIHSSGQGYNQIGSNLLSSKKHYEIKISTFDVGQVFGHEDVLRKRNYTSSVRCVTEEGSLYMIKADEFFYRMQTSDKTW